MAPAPPARGGLRARGRRSARGRLRRRPPRGARAGRPRLPPAPRRADPRAARHGAPPVLSTAPPEDAAALPARRPAVAAVAVASVGAVTAAQPAPAFPDADSTAWVAALGGAGPAREAAVERLHALLLRAARFELRRRGPRADPHDPPPQAAPDPPAAILPKPHTHP